MRNSFEAVPRLAEEAAMIDGAGSLQILRRIFLPAGRAPAIITVVLFAFIMSWNGVPRSTRHDDRRIEVHPPFDPRQLPLGGHSPVGTDSATPQAGITDLDHPGVVVHLLLQRYFVAGLLTGAVK